MKGALVSLGVVAVFVAAVAFTLPTDTLVRRELASVRQPGWPDLTFDRAVLRPSGVVFEDAQLHAPDGRTLLVTPWLAARPSLLGLVRGARGFPWTVRALICGTSADLMLATGAEGLTADLHWHDGDLATCKGIPFGGGTLLGRAGSDARVRFDAGLPRGEGQVDVKDVLWKGGATASGFAFRAAAATVHWTLADGRVELTDITLHGPDAEATGHGEIRLGTPFARSEVDVQLGVVPGASASSLIRALLALLPPDEIDPARRRLRLVGPIDRVQVLRE